MRSDFMRLPWLLVVLLLLPTATVYSAPPDGYNFLPLTDAMQQSQVENKPMFLYFGRFGCSTCRKMHKEIFSDASVKKNYNEKFILAYVDTESGNRIRLPNGETTTEMQYAARSRILGTPTFVFFSSAQKPLFKRAGFQTIEQMNRYSEYVSSGKYHTQTLKEYLSTK